MMRGLTILVTLLFTWACSSISTNQPIQFFLLDDAPSEAVDKTVSYSPQNPQIVVAVAPVRIAEYLQQKNMVMRLNANQLHFSRQNMWAEDLQYAINNAISSDLNNMSDDLHYVAANSPGKHQATYILVTHIKHFLPTEQSTVLLSGEFWILDALSHAPIQQQSFSYSADLSTDGYRHAVGQMRQLLTQLSSDITAQVNAL